MRSSAWMMLMLMIFVIANVGAHPDQYLAWVIAITYMAWYVLISILPEDED